MKRLRLSLLVAILAVSAIFAGAQSWKLESDAPMDSTNTIQTIIDVVDAFTTYVGKAKNGSSRALACWQVFRIYNQDGGTVTVIQFYDGDAGYRGVWDQRATATYR
jgi:hypothetical protein